MNRKYVLYSPVNCPGIAEEQVIKPQDHFEHNTPQVWGICQPNANIPLSHFAE